MITFMKQVFPMLTKPRKPINLKDKHTNYFNQTSYCVPVQIKHLQSAPEYFAFA